MTLKFITSAIGRRKESTAVIKLYELTLDETVELVGVEETVMINGLIPEVYLQFNSRYMSTISLPLEVLSLTDKYRIDVTVHGGGLSGQTNAIKLGLARALCKLDSTYRPLLKSYGFLTRDARIKESKKYGLKKARKASQFSKR
jgi:small subunit ribosomal protein S9|tara:strand:- start:4109 stop:4540 length:432 start_codon:yes stop_codon:yes gene_type:complete